MVMIRSNSMTWDKGKAVWCDPINVNQCRHASIYATVTAFMVGHIPPKCIQIKRPSVSKSGDKKCLWVRARPDTAGQ